MSSKIFACQSSYISVRPKTETRWNYSWYLQPQLYFPLFWNAPNINKSLLTCDFTINCDISTKKRHQFYSRNFYNEINTQIKIYILYILFSTLSVFSGNYTRYRSSNLIENLLWDSTKIYKILSSFIQT